MNENSPEQPGLTDPDVAANLEGMAVPRVSSSPEQSNPGSHDPLVVQIPSAAENMALDFGTTGHAVAPLVSENPVLDFGRASAAVTAVAPPTAVTPVVAEPAVVDQAALDQAAAAEAAKTQAALKPAKTSPPTDAAASPDVNEAAVATDPAATDPAAARETRPAVVGLPALGQRSSGTAITPVSNALTSSVGTQPLQVVLDPRMMAPVTVPRTMQWTPWQLLQVALAMGTIALLGLVAGWFFGGTRETEFAARSEFIYFLEDAVPDGFLREDRRILTQLVTIESETSLRPIAAEFDTTVKDIRQQLNVEVIELSEVIRLDIVDPDPLRALAINQAVLDRYQEIASQNDRRSSSSPMIERRDGVLAELDVVDQEFAVVAEAELSDVALQLQEESLTRELGTATTRVDRLSAISDGLLTETTLVDDRGSLEAQVQASQQRLIQLQAELLTISTERGELQRAISRQLASEAPVTATANQQRDVTLGVREDSVRLEIQTVSQRIQSLESALANSLLDNQVATNGVPVEQELVGARQLVSDLEDQLLVVRTRRAELAQSAATGPSLLRRVERLEQELATLDSELASTVLTADGPSPIAVLTPPVVLDEPAGNPKITWAALGMLASLPFAGLAGFIVRSRQRKRL